MADKIFHELLCTSSSTEFRHKPIFRYFRHFLKFGEALLTRLHEKFYPFKYLTLSQSGKRYFKG